MVVFHFHDEKYFCKANLLGTAVFPLSCHSLNLGGVVLGKCMSKKCFGTEYTINSFSFENIQLDKRVINKYI